MGVMGKMGRIEQNRMLSGRIALVTGGAAGIGRAVAKVMQREGARVAVADTDIDGSLQTIQEMDGDNQHCAIQMNVADTLSVEEGFKKVLANYNEPPSVIVNSAGIIRDCYLLKRTDQQFDQAIGVNLRGTHLVNKTAGLMMKDHNIDKGSIVNISSVIGKVGAVGQTNYAASKAGVIGFTKATAKELARFGIRCNCICPGYIETAMTAGIPEHIQQMTMMAIPLGKPGQPEDIAETALFLASEKAKYITGAAIDVNGGLL